MQLYAEGTALKKDDQYHVQCNMFSRMHFFMNFFFLPKMAKHSEKSLPVVLLLMNRFLSNSFVLNLFQG